jgi:hypothetical protein
VGRGICDLVYVNNGTWLTYLYIYVFHLSINILGLALVAHESPPALKQGIIPFGSQVPSSEQVSFGYVLRLFWLCVIRSL